MSVYQTLLNDTFNINQPCNIVNKKVAQKRCQKNKRGTAINTYNITK